MCIILSSTVELSNTIIYSAEVEKPGVGPVHVIGYQNSINSYGVGPNAMILPIPTNDLLGPENVIDASCFPNILKDYAKAIQSLKPNLRRGTLGGDVYNAVSAAAGLSMTFDSGSYTIALADSASGLKKAIDNVTENRRPNIPIQFLMALSNLYPGWPLAVCCFNESEFENREMEPIFLWFKSKFPEKLFAPAIDAHDGNPPLNNVVLRDHALIFGNYKASNLRVKLKPLNEKIQEVPEQDRWMFTHAIVGSTVSGIHSNGDFVFPKKNVKDPKFPGYIGSDQIKTESPF